MKFPNIPGQRNRCNCQCQEISQHPDTGLMPNLRLIMLAIYEIVFSAGILVFGTSFDICDGFPAVFYFENP